MRKLRPLQQAYYPDVLQSLDVPIVGVIIQQEEQQKAVIEHEQEQAVIEHEQEQAVVEQEKAVVGKKKAVIKKAPVLKPQEIAPQRKVSMYNTFVKEKRIELMALYPKLSKGDIYEMAKKAYRETK